MKPRTRRSRLLVSILWLCAVLLGSPALADGTSIAVVDLQGAVMQTEDGIRAQAQLKKLLDKRQVTLDSKQKEMAKMRGDIERQAPFLSREALTRRMELWQKEMLTLQTVFIDYNKELEKRQAELTDPIIKRMIGLVSKLASKNGHDLVIDKRAAPYARPDLDLTDRVVAMYNAGESG